MKLLNLTTVHNVKEQGYQMGYILFNRAGEHAE